MRVNGAEAELVATVPGIDTDRVRAAWLRTLASLRDEGWHIDQTGREGNLVTVTLARNDDPAQRAEVTRWACAWEACAPRRHH